MSTVAALEEIQPFIRPATADDLADIMRLEETSLVPPWSRATVERALTDTHTITLMVRLAGEAAAYAAAWHLDEEAEITRLAVLPQFRRRGLARGLVQAMLAHLQGTGVRRVFLEVRAGNDAAARLYEAQGFEYTGRRRGYYNDGEDALMMAWSQDPD